MIKEWIVLRPPPRLITGLLMSLALSSAPISGNPGVVEPLNLGGEPEATIADTAVRLVPYVVLNTLPGFGLGSWLQGQPRGALYLTATDVLAYGLIVPATVLMLTANDDDEATVGLFLLGGFVAWAGSRVAGVTVPVVSALRHGVDRESLVAPIFYNTVPGFGLGSTLQGDMHGARIIQILDAVAFISLGLGAGMALSGSPSEVEKVVTAASMITFLACYTTARTFGVARPIGHRTRVAAVGSPAS